MFRLGSVLKKAQIMNKKNSTPVVPVMLTLFLFLVAGAPVLAKDSGGNLLKPFRVLVIIGDQWDDPAGYMVTHPKPLPGYSGYFTQSILPGQEDFHHLMILLKSWSIPFDVIRLDQQILDRYMFLDMHGKPKYGTIIWDVNKSEKVIPPDYTILKEIVNDYGTGLIALTDRIFPEPIQSLLGLNYDGSWESSKKMKVTTKHFLTKGLSSPFVLDEGVDSRYNYGLHLKREQVEVKNGTVTLVKQGSLPQVTAKTLSSGAHTVWIGNDPGYLFLFPEIRTLLRRAITWTIGYNLYKTWDKEVIMIMDDPGGAQNVYLEHWQYPELTEDVIEKYLIKPLLERNAILNINFVPAFVSDEKQRLEPSWTQNFTDGFGIHQDYVSAKKGFDKGVKQGVFEVMCHGLTHMQPDLVSAPGWYGTPLNREKAEVGWYREFGDTRRHREIPAAEQLWRLRTGKEWLTEQFGVVPLEFCAGGNGVSLSYPNNTFLLAARAGFGWAGWNAGYLGTDMVVLDWDFNGTPDAPLITGALPNGHDFGITKDPEAFAKIFEQYPRSRFIGINEFIGYIHAATAGQWDAPKKSLLLSIDYDPHYCHYFSDHPSRWTFEMADWLMKEKGNISSIEVDGEKTPLKQMVSAIVIPAGTGEHKIEVAFR